MQKRPIILRNLLIIATPYCTSLPKSPIFLHLSPTLLRKSPINPQKCLFPPQKSPAFPQKKPRKEGGKIFPPKRVVHFQVQDSWVTRFPLSAKEPGVSAKEAFISAKEAYTSKVQDSWRHRLSLQHTATHCNTLQRTATHCNTLQRTATHCNTLQHTATHCNTLQHTLPSSGFMGMTDCTENAAPLKSTKSKNSNSSVQIQIKSTSQFEFIPRVTEKSELLDFVDFGMQPELGRVQLFLAGI